MPASPGDEASSPSLPSSPSSPASGPGATRVPDLVVALLWAAFGVIVFIASWRMERLEKLGIDRWSAPGLTPGVVGALIVVLALVLAWKAYRPGDIDAAEPDTEKSSVDGADDAGLSAATTRRTLLAAALCVLFAGITLGHGLPFVVEGALFILAFTAAFSWRAWRDEGRIGRGLLQTAAVAVAASVTISWLFESVFLVRLP